MTAMLDHSPTTPPTAQDDSPAALREQLDRLSATLRSTEADRDLARADLADFKDRVADVGDRAAREHGWCHTFDGILDELGLTRPVRRVTGTVTVTLEITGDPTDPDRGVETEFFRDSIRDSAFQYDVMDGDWSGVEVTVHAIDVHQVSLCTD